ncbi:hypothetical protein RRG08_004849, partial [Elysia crispata]
DPTHQPLAEFSHTNGPGSQDITGLTLTATGIPISASRAQAHRDPSARSRHVRPGVDQNLGPMMSGSGLELLGIGVSQRTHVGNQCSLPEEVGPGSAPNGSCGRLLQAVVSTGCARGRPAQVHHVPPVSPTGHGSRLQRDSGRPGCHARGGLRAVFHPAAASWPLLQFHRLVSRSG